MISSSLTMDILYSHPIPYSSYRLLSFTTHIELVYTLVSYYVNSVCILLNTSSTAMCIEVEYYFVSYQVHRVRTHESCCLSLSWRQEAIEDRKIQNMSLSLESAANKVYRCNGISKVKKNLNSYGARKNRRPKWSVIFIGAQYTVYIAVRVEMDVVSPS